MSLLNYFVPKKVAGSAPTVVVITNNDSSRNTGGDVSSSSDDDPVYVEVVEKTQKILAARNLGQGVIDVDRSSVSHRFSQVHNFICQEPKHARIVTFLNV